MMREDRQVAHKLHSLSVPRDQHQGLPLGLQIAGFTDKDAELLAAADAILGLYRDDLER